MASERFQFRQCEILRQAIGGPVESLETLRRKIDTIPETSLDFHFWSGLLRGRYDDQEFRNGFATWADHGLSDPLLAERLAVVDPHILAGGPSLRRRLGALLDERMSEVPELANRPARQPFRFIEPQLVVYETGAWVDRPADLVAVLPDLPERSIFYHFVERRCRRMADDREDLLAWLRGIGPETADLVHRLTALRPQYFRLWELKQRIVELVRAELVAGR